MIASSEFTVFRKDRGTGRKGGGVCIIARNYSRFVYKSVELHLHYNRLKLLVIDVLIGPKNGTGLTVVRNPLDHLSDLNMCMLLISALTFISNTNLSIGIVGDFNLL